MTNAGIYAGEVTNAAPADEAPTSKARSYQWMEYGSSPPPTPEQNRILMWFDYEEGSGGANTKLYSTDHPTWFAESQNAYNPAAGVVDFGATLSATGSQFHQFTPGYPQNDGSWVSTLRDQVWGHTFWFKTGATLLGQGELVLSAQWQSFSGGSPAEGSNKWAIRYNTAANGLFFHIGNNINPFVWVTLDTGNIGLAADTWYHVAATHDGVADEMTLTVSPRGGPVGTRFTQTVSGGAWISTSAGAPDPEASRTWHIGGRGSIPPESVIDMAAFWNSDAILSVEDVTQLVLEELTYADLTDTPATTSIVYDTFDEVVSGIALNAHTPNKVASTGWVIETGTPTIEANRVSESAAGALSVGTIETGVSDCVIAGTISADEDAFSVSAYSGLCARMTDEDNGFYCALSSVTTTPWTWAIIKIEGGVPTTLASATGVSTGPIIGVSHLLINATASITVNGDSIRFEVPTQGIDISAVSTFNQTVTTHGIHLFKGTGMADPTVDNFKVT